MGMMKKIIGIAFLAMMCVFLINTNVSFAVSLESMEKDAKDFIQKGKDNSGDLTPVVGTVTDNFQGLGQILTIVGAGVLVAVVSYMGIKYMISPPDKQADLKNRLIYVVVAGIVIFGAYGIWRAILSVVSHF